jgi:hypothetical protein
MITAFLSTNFFQKKRALLVAGEKNDAISSANKGTIKKLASRLKRDMIIAVLSTISFQKKFAH